MTHLHCHVPVNQVNVTVTNLPAQRARSGCFLLPIPTTNHGTNTETTATHPGQQRGLTPDKAAKGRKPQSSLVNTDACHLHACSHAESSNTPKPPSVMAKCFRMQVGSTLEKSVSHVPPTVIPARGRHSIHIFECKTKEQRVVLLH